MAQTGPRWNPDTGQSKTCVRPPSGGGPNSGRAQASGKRQPKPAPYVGGQAQSQRLNGSIISTGSVARRARVVKAGLEAAVSLALVNKLVRFPFILEVEADSLFEGNAPVVQICLLAEHTSCVMLWRAYHPVQLHCLLKLFRFALHDFKPTSGTAEWAADAGAARQAAVRVSFREPLAALVTVHWQFIDERVTVLNPPIAARFDSHSLISGDAKPHFNRGLS